MDQLILMTLPGSIDLGLLGILVIVFGWAYELLSGHVTAQSSLTNWTLHTGVTLTIRDIPGRISLLGVWTDQQAAGQIRILSALAMHDQSRGLTFNNISANVRNLLHYSQELRANETLTVQQSGSATAGDIESGCLLVGYEGLQGRFITPAELAERSTGKVVAVENTLALGTAGGVSGEEAINAESDLLISGVDYALVGYHVNAECTAIRWRNTTTTLNLPVGGPGNPTAKEETGMWFIWLSHYYGIPAIPVFNFTDKGGILIDGIQDENGVDPVVNSIFVQLKGKTAMHQRDFGFVRRAVPSPVQFSSETASETK